MDTANCSPLTAHESTESALTSDLLIGVDAGGSHTTAVVADATLVERGRADGPQGAVSPGFAEDAARAIAETVKAALQAAGQSGTQAVLVVGAAGVGRAEQRDALRAALEGYGLARRMEIVTDAAIALEDGLGDKPGILLSVGSGSIAYARDASGTLWRAGGLGWRIGDEGSGYWLGRAALQAVGKSADGRASATVLSTALAKATGSRTVDALMDWARTADRTQVVALARVTCDVALAGDHTARILVDEAARELGEHVRALALRFPDSTSVEVALNGKLLSLGSPVRDALLEEVTDINPAISVFDRPVEPPRGALLLAQRARA